MNFKNLAAKSLSLVSLTLFLSSGAFASTDLPMDSIASEQATTPEFSANVELPKPNAKGDQKFRALFTSWKRLDQVGQGILSIPSARPVEGVSMTSGFGVRSDPFRRSAAMHAGIDLAGPIGTPIYATADGIISYSGWMRGYGNLIEIAHGKAIETRYGHLSKILVRNNMPVKRGQLIGLMGSTGRSTGSHLHYEVRLDGHAVNPVPYLQTTDYLLAMQRRATDGQVALGGPDD
jgi:murein DD-endopeptidase MepM/ murein hydrolase activator NlpD